MDFVYRSKSTTTKGLIHITIHENTIREFAHEKLTHFKHIQGENNPADIFIKEHKDTQHFLNIHDHLAPEKFSRNDIPVIRTKFLVILLTSRSGGYFMYTYVGIYIKSILNRYLGPKK